MTECYVVLFGKLYHEGQLGAAVLWRMCSRFQMVSQLVAMVVVSFCSRGRQQEAVRH